jgi:ribonuclease HI
MITIYTDASYIPSSGIGSIAYIIKSEEEEIKGGKKLGKIEDVTYGELYAIMYALELCVKNFDDDIIELHTDNMTCYRYLIPFVHTKPKRHDLQKLYDQIFYLLRKYKFKLKTYHVKAHKELTTNKKINNDWCDIKAKEYTQ